MYIDTETAQSIINNKNSGMFHYLQQVFLNSTPPFIKLLCLFKI